METAINLNFNMVRNGVYPESIDEICTSSNEQIMYWINNLNYPTNETQLTLFNEVFNQFHIRGGRT